MNLDPTERFSDRVENYRRFRPGYPASLLPVIAAELPLDPSWVVADIGSGTGLSTAPFLDNGNAVFGVEPNDEMRRAAETLFDKRPGFRSVAGTAERTGLETGSVDLIVAGQAFHWFDPVKTRSEWNRILRSPKWTVLFWNSRHQEGTDFLREYEALLLRYGTDYQGIRHESTESEVVGEFYGRPFVRRTVPNAQALNLASLRGRLLSSSYAPPPGHPDHEPMLDALEGLFGRCEVDGQVSITYETEIFIGKLN